MFRLRHPVSALLFCAALMVMTPPPVCADEKWEISLHTGPWTAFPFTTLIENLSRRAILHELESLIDWAFPVLLIRSRMDTVEFDSSGYTFGLAFVRRFTPGPWSMGIRLSRLMLDLPYTLDTLQSLDLLGIPLADIRSRISGTARIRSLEAALTIHYGILHTKRIRTELLAGVHLCPLTGNLDLSGDVQLNTPLGSSLIPLGGSTTFATLRRNGLDLPKMIFYPSLGASTALSLNRTMSLAFRLTLSQGLFLDAGLVMGF